MADKKPQRPPQSQSHQPGQQSEMRPQPKADASGYVGSDKLNGKVALITGGDSGIGRAVAAHYAKEGAHIVISYLEERDDARATEAIVEAAGAHCLAIPGDIGDPEHVAQLVRTAIDRFGRLDVLVNNAAEQHDVARLEDLDFGQLVQTFRTNVFGMFELTRVALAHLQAGASIINTTSVTAYRGSQHLVDYAATKGAIVAFTRSLSTQLAPRGIRVNAVAPGPIWTPLIPASFDAEKVARFGSDVPMGRAGEPDEVAPCFVFLACKDSSYMTGQVLHPNGGEIING